MTGRPHIFLDIEAAPAAPQSPAWLRYRATTLAAWGPVGEYVEPAPVPPKAPSNYGEAKAAAYVAERWPAWEAALDAHAAAAVRWPGEEAARREAELEQLRQQTTFDPMLGSISCVCWAVDDGEVQSVDARGGEAAMLAELNRRLSFVHGGVFVIHNGNGYDVPFLQTRALLYGLPSLAHRFGRPGCKPWERPVVDLLEAWPRIPTWGGKEGRVPVRKGANGASMATLCAALGIPDFGDLDGSEAGAAWERGECDRVIEHCRFDVERNRAVWDCIFG